MLTGAGRLRAREGVVRCEIIDRVALITLNRPEVLNAVNSEVAGALGDLIAEYGSDPHIRAAVITGAGRAFCSGQDVAALASGDEAGPLSQSGRGFAGMTNQIINKPIVAAVNGLAYGGGLEIALACDIIVMADDARVALPEVKLGLIAAGGGLPRIAQTLPPKVAAKLLYTGEPIEATDALRWGLASDIVPRDDVVARSLEIAHSISANSPRAVQASKRSLQALTTESSWSEDAWRLVAKEYGALVASPDAEEGTTAFLQKRSPVWRDD